MSRPRTLTLPGTTGRIIRQLSGAIAVIAYSALEEEFFRAGDQLAEGHDFSDLDEGYERPTLWRAIVGWLRGERTKYTE